MAELDLATIEKVKGWIYWSSPKLERWGWEYKGLAAAEPGAVQ